MFTGSAALALASHDADQADAALTVAPMALSGTVDNYATAAIVQSSGAGTLQQSGTNYTLNLGTIAAGSTLATALAVENAATGLADLLSGSFVVAGSSSAFINSGFAPFSGLGAGAQDTGLDVAVPASDAPGTYSETMTLYGTGSNSSGYSGTLLPETVTISAEVIAYATVSAVTPNPVNLGNVHVGATPSKALSVENTAPTGAENLDGSIGGATGAATTNGGSFAGLAPGVTDSTSLSVGLDTATDGVQSGTAIVSLESDGTGIDSNLTTALTAQTIDVTGTVYAYAAPVVSNTTLDFGPTRVGGTVTAQSIAIANGTTADPYQENLLYSLQNTLAGRLQYRGPASGTVVSGSTTLASAHAEHHHRGQFQHGTARPVADLDRRGQRAGQHSAHAATRSPWRARFMPPRWRSSAPS